MSKIIHTLTEKFRNAVTKAFQIDFPIELTQSTNEKFGDYQLNSAMKMAKSLGMAPRQIAEKIIQNTDFGQEILKLEAAGPGFINITLNPAYLSELVNAQLSDPLLGVEKHANEKVVIDFSSPNTAKEMHVGHLRSTIIGDTLARLFEFLGADVLRLNHIGDWGTSFGMLIAYIKEIHPDLNQSTLQQLVQWYKEAKVKFDNDADFKKRSQLEVVALQGGDPQALQIWKTICEISRKAYQEIYDLLNIRLTERGESYYNPVLAATVKDLEERGLVTVSDGAKCIFLEGFTNRDGDPLPVMVQKSDGAYNYDTTDMAAIKQRIFEEKADRLIYVTDAGQSTHFQMIFKAAEKAGYLDPQKVRVDHVGFGLVLGSDGKKFRTRSGETEKLMDLLTAAIDKAQEILDERSPQMSLDERKTLAKAIGLGAIKYSDLSSHRMSDYHFSYDKMLRFEGNTAAYLMYSYVRVSGIKRKVGLDPASLTDKIVLQHPSEVALGLHLLRFSEAVEQVTSDLCPNRITDYLYQLAEKFNAFFRDCRVEGTPEQNSRLLLCEDTAKVLKQGLSILGIQTVDRM